MRMPEEIIIRPHITERSTMDIAEGKYTFVVDKKATKPEIRSAVETLFGVKVVSVNTANYNGKIKRMGVHSGRTASWKKAIVKIDLNPAAEQFFDEGGKTVANNKKYKTSIDEFGFAQ